MKNILLKLYVLIAAIFTFCEFAYSQETSLLPVSLFDIYAFKEVMGYVDTTGAIVIEPKFEFADKFYEGYAVIKLDGKYGAIDKNGKIVIKPIYDKVWPFTDGLCRIQLNKKIGFVDQMGEMVIPPNFSTAGGFKEGLAAVLIEDKFGFIDKMGKIVITPAYASAKYFSEGLCAVKLTDAGRLWGFIDKTGTMVIKPQFEGWTANDILSFEDGLAFVQKEEDKLFGDTYWYVINKKGEIVLNTNIRYVENPTMKHFSEGLAVFGRGNAKNS